MAEQFDAETAPAVTRAGRFTELFRRAPVGPVFRPLWIWLPLLLLAVTTVVIWRFDLDLRIQHWIYETGERSWRLGDEPFWKGLYRFGPIPALVVTLGAVAAYTLSWSRARWKPWRRVLLFVILVAITGPGLVTNLTLKDNWGRPRPREVEGLGGRYAFEPVLTIDRESEGKSFPCGHATMGFVFLGGFFLFRRYRAVLAFWFLGGGLLAGTLTGIARMMQGGHFLSDVIWAAGVCWFVPMGLYYALGLHRGLLQSAGVFEKVPRGVVAASWTVGLAIFAAAMFATPFRIKRDYFLVNEAARTAPLHLNLLLELGEFELMAADRLHIHGEAYGHGVPTSKVAAIYEERPQGDYWDIWYMERISGRLSEANQQMKIELPRERTKRIGIRTGEARIWIEPFVPVAGFEMHLYDGTGEIHFLDSEIPVRVLRHGEEAKPGAGDFRVYLHSGFAGKVTTGKDGRSTVPPPVSEE